MVPWGSSRAGIPFAIPFSSPIMKSWDLWIFWDAANPGIAVQGWEADVASQIKQDHGSTYKNRCCFPNKTGLGDDESHSQLSSDSTGRRCRTEEKKKKIQFKNHFKPFCLLNILVFPGKLCRSGCVPVNSHPREQPCLLHSHYPRSWAGH